MAQTRCNMRGGGRLAWEGVGLLIPCSKELVGSNPTPRAIIGDSGLNLSFRCNGIQETALALFNDIQLVHESINSNKENGLRFGNYTIKYDKRQIRP